MLRAPQASRAWGIRVFLNQFNAYRFPSVLPKYTVSPTTTGDDRIVPMVRACARRAPCRHRKLGLGNRLSHLMLPSALVMDDAFCFAPFVSNTQAGFCVFRSIAVSFPAKLPMYSTPLASAPASVITRSVRRETRREGTVRYLSLLAGEGAWQRQ